MHKIYKNEINLRFMADRADMSFYDPERVEAGVSTKPEILDGRDAKDLLDAKRKFLLKSGEVVIAGTHMGIGYKSRNEDRIGVDPENDFIIVADGMGGHGDGDKATSILVEELVRDNLDIQKSVDAAVEKMKEAKLAPRAGAVFTAMRVVESGGDKFLDGWYAGDAPLFVADETGKVVFVLKGQSLVNEKIDSGSITEDQALSDPDRNIVRNPIGVGRVNKVMPFRVPLKSGYRVYAMSDGIGKNITPKEASLLTTGKHVQEAFQIIAENVYGRMANADKIIEDSWMKRISKGKYTDNFLSAPGSDNAAFVVFDIE